MARGGKRAGAGRKRNGHNKVSEARAERASQSGMLPCEVMLEAMRYFRGLAARHSENGPEPNAALSRRYLREAASIAKDCAPYYHSRLAQTTLQTNPDKPIVHTLEVRFV